MNRFPGKLALQQRVLPNYRAPFFDLLASTCDGGMGLFAGLPRRNEGITITDKLQVAHYTMGNTLHLFSEPFLGERFYLYYQKGLIDWLDKQNPEILIIDANPRCLSTSAATRWMHERNRQVIGWGLGAPPANRFREKRRASFLSQFDAMITYSQRGADEYAAQEFPLDHLFVAHNSVSPSPTWPMPKRPESFNDKPCILFVGRLQARKNVDLLLSACAKIQDVRLVIVGDGPERKAFERLAEDIYPEAEFVGAKHGAELKAYFEEADLFVLPGTGGLAVQEAMSYGLPIIVAQGDGTQDDLVREENGWQVTPDDFSELVNTIKDALSDTARLRKMGEVSYQIVKDEINIEKMVDVFISAMNAVSTI